MSELDLIVIGAGPGGYVCAIRAAQLGLEVACVEKEKDLGGTCLRIGCIPSKALLEASEQYARAQHRLSRFGVKLSGVELDLAAMMRHKDAVVKANTRGVDFLFRKNKIRRVLGTARIVQPGVVEVSASDDQTERLEAPNIVIATGSEASTLPGAQFDGQRVTSSTEALAYPVVPDSLVVIGAGYIGLEMGSVWSRLGARVTVLEFLPRILPGMDAELAREAHKILAKQGLDIRLNSRVTGAVTQGDKAVITYRDEDDTEQSLEADHCLLAVGRHPFTRGLGLDDLGIQTDRRGVIQVDQRFQTNVEGIYAIGDAIPGPMLAHKASEEGVAVAEIIVTGHGHVNYDAIPAVAYTEPEIASVGHTEEALEEAGTPYKKGKFPFSANGRARALGTIEGFVKILSHAHTDRLLGVHIIGPRAGDLIAEAATAIDLMASAEDIARTSHAHPTLAEAVKEAALGVEGRAIHI